MSIRIDRRDGLWVLALDRPPVNAVNLAFARALADAVAEAAATDDCEAIVVTGAAGVFCAGIDTRDVPSYDTATAGTMLRLINRTILELYGLPKPVVAAVSGHALGAGLVLALTCDVRLAARGPFRLGLTEVEAGIPFPAAPLCVVQAELSPETARLLCLTGLVESPEAPVFSRFLDRVVEPTELLDEAERAARRLVGLRSYGRVKLQLRRETLARLRHIVDHDEEPLLRNWI